MKRLWRVAWFRFRASFAAGGGLLAIVLLIGLTGGIVSGSLAGARRTQSSYPRFLAGTNPSDLTVSSFGEQGATEASLKKTIAGIRGVKRVTSVYVPPITIVTATGAPTPSATASVFMVGSTDGELFDQDRVSVVHGRMADPTRANEVALTASAASQLKARVGTVLRLGLFPNHAAPARLRVNATVVGVVEFNNQVIQDDIDAAFGFVVLTPCLMREVISVAPAAASPTLYGLQLDHGASGVAEVERGLVGREEGRGIRVPSQLRPSSRKSKTRSGRSPSRWVRSASSRRSSLWQLPGRRSPDTFVPAKRIAQVLRALGAGPAMTTVDGLFDVLGAIIVGAIIAALFAISPVSTRSAWTRARVYPASGLAFDWTVLGLGLAGFVVVSGGVAIAIVYRRAPHRAPPRRRERSRGRRSRAASAAGDLGLPVPVVTGVRFAFEPGVGRGSVPVRSALTGTVIAVAMVVATLTFASGLRTLVSHPALYGWNWNYAINPSNEVPPRHPDAPHA